MTGIDTITAFKEFVNNFTPCCTSDEYHLILFKKVLELLKEQDTVEHACDILRANGWTETEPICSECDAIHVVRCKDCRFRVLHQCNCEKKENVTYGMFTEDDFFCANGEQKE